MNEIIDPDTGEIGPSSSATLMARLAAPFPPETISWRVGATMPDKSRGIALAYIDARDVQDRLDQVCGIFWQTRHHHCGTERLACDIGIKVGGEWLWRGDGAGSTDVEAEKGAFSDSFKRAAVRWGIGRYLYDLDSPWVKLEAKGKSHVIAASEMANLNRLLVGKSPVAARAPTEAAGTPLVERAYDAARGGSVALRGFWAGLGREQRVSMKPLLENELKPIAEIRDRMLLDHGFDEQNPAGGFSPSSSPGAPSGHVDPQPEPEGALPDQLRDYLGAD